VRWIINTGFVRGLKNLKCFGNFNFLVGLEIWGNPIKSHGDWHFGHGDFIFHNEPNVYLALILFSHPNYLALPYQHDQGSWESQFMVEVDSTKALNKPQSMPDPIATSEAV
jgi:hypothetical protein